ELDEENDEKSNSETDQSEVANSVTSPKQQVVATQPTVESPSDSKFDSVQLETNLHNSDRESPPMAASDKRGPSPSVSFSELPKVLSTNSYLAAALKASVTSLSSSGGRSYTETTTSPSSSPTLQIKQEPFSQQESSSHPTKSNSKQQQQHSLKSPSPGEIVNSVNSIASSLLNSDAVSNTFSNMIQGIPLLSSV
ncbi:hypothetical protein Anas_01965, partial [Armadillidium nasatum]